ncbi:MAG: hypothetical protein ABIP48_31915 [Planctomycetota bacterium]
MEQLERQVRRAQRQLAFQRFVGVLGWCWFAALWLALGLIVADKFWPLGVEARIWGAGALGLGVAAAAFWAVMRGRGPVDAAIEIDRRYRLKERVSSALAMSDEERATPLGRALVDDAEARVRRIDVGEHFSISPGRQMLLPLIPALLAVLVVLFVSPAANNPAQANTDPAVKKQIKNSSDDLRRKLLDKRKEAQEKGLKDAEKLFRQLEEGANDLADRSEGRRKEALVKLNDLARKIKERREELGGADQVRKQLDQLKNVERGPADEFLQAVKQGNLQKAMEELEKLKSKVAEGSLNEQQREQLAKQLDQMKEKLNKLAEAQQKAQEDLKKRIDQARQEGRNAEADNLQDQLDALRQQMPQMKQLEGLAEKLGNCAQCLRDNQLQDAGDMLDNLQADVASLQEQLQELDMLNEALGQLGQCRSQMNCPACGGQGCGACQGKMPGDGEGMGDGQGKGDRPEEENPVDFIDTKPPMKTGPGGASIVGEVQGRNLKGDVQLEMSEQVQAARRQSADPVTVEHLPRGYQDHARDYLNRLREGE